MKVIGKIGHTEYDQIEKELKQSNKEDYITWTVFKIFMLLGLFFFVSIALVGAIHMMIYNTKTNLDNLWPQVLLTFSVLSTIFIALTYRKYSFDPLDLSWPQTYRYFVITKGKTVIKDIVCLDTASGNHADLEVVVQNEQGVEENVYVGSFGIELRNDIQESVLDLKKERLYVPYTADDIEIPE